MVWITEKTSASSKLKLTSPRLAAGFFTEDGGPGCSGGGRGCPGGKGAGAVALLEVLPVMDPEAQPGVVARVRPVKAGPVLGRRLANGRRGYRNRWGHRGWRTRIDRGRRRRGFRQRSGCRGGRRPGDHLEERLGVPVEAGCSVLDRWGRERPPGLKRAGKSIEEPGPKPIRPRRFHRGPPSRQRNKKITRFERSLENLLVKNDSLWCCLFLLLPLAMFFLKESDALPLVRSPFKSFFSNLIDRNYNEKKGN